MKELYVFYGTFGVFHLGEDINGVKKEFKDLGSLIDALEPYYSSGRYVIVAKFFPKDDLELFKMELKERYPNFEVAQASKRDKK